MSGVNRLPVEKYTCPECDAEFTSNEVRNSWRCPTCKGFIQIWAHDPKTDVKITLIRKRGDEIESGDMVHLPWQLTKDCYRVLGTSKVQNMIGIGLKDYGQYRVEPDEAINCRVGGG